MSELRDEIAALRESLTELRVGVARRWAARRGEPLRGALERSVRQAGLRILAETRPAHRPSTGRRRPLGSGASGGLPDATGRRAQSRPLAERRRAAGVVLLVAALLWPLLVWLPIGASTTTKLLLGLAVVGSGALGLRLLRKA